MKSVCIAFVLLFTVNLSWSQTYFETDSLNVYLHNMINEYRSENGLDELLLDTGLVKACQHHSRYLSFYDTLTLKGFAQHNEINISFAHLQEPINRVEKRANRYANVGSYISENVFVSEFNKDFAVNHFYVNGDKDYRDGNVEFIKSINSINPDYKSLAKYIISAWKISPSHNQALLDSRGYKSGAYAYFYRSQSGAYMTAATYLVTDDEWETEIKPIIDGYSR